MPVERLIDTFLLPFALESYSPPHRTSVHQAVPVASLGSKLKQIVDCRLMLDRTGDGTQQTAPREVIHLLNTLRTRQVERFQLGQPEPCGDLLFEQATFKEALPEVSKVRLTQTLYAEYPALRAPLEELRGKKTSQTANTVATVWKISPADARQRADELVQIGFFERRATSDEPQYWVPFLYRDALEMVQGSAE